MRILPCFIVVLAGGLSLASVASAQTQTAAGDRPWHLYGQALDVTADEFRTCFSGVSPDRDHAPSGATQRMNKAVLLPCLQAANPAITNNMLDGVMDSLRPEGPMRG